MTRIITRTPTGNHRGTAGTPPGTIRGKRRTRVLCKAWVPPQDRTHDFELKPRTTRTRTRLPAWGDPSRIHSPNTSDCPASRLERLLHSSFMFRLVLLRHHVRSASDAPEPAFLRWRAQRAPPHQGPKSCNCQEGVRAQPRPTNCGAK